MKRAARVRMRRIHFVDEATTEVMDRLFDACAGLDGIEAIGCKFKTDLSWLAYLESLNQRLIRAAASGQDAKSVLPSQVEIASPSTESLPPESQIRCDSRCGQMIEEYLQVVAFIPSFLGAELTAKQHRDRFATFEDSGQLMAAALASGRASLVNDFASDQHANRNGDMDWALRQKFLPVARLVYAKFFDKKLLLTKQFDDPRDALNPAVACCLRLTLTAWFKPLEKLEGNDPLMWQAWQEHLGVEEISYMWQLAEALDLALTVLRAA